MQKFCFIKFSSQAPNPNTYSYTLQCLTLTHCAPEGGARARGWGCSSSSGRKRDRREGGGHWKVFLFLPDNILWQVLRGEAAGKGRKWGWRLFDFGFFGWTGRCGPCGWAWQHIGTLPDYATEKFIHFLFTFHDKTARSSRPSSLCTSLTPFLLLATTPLFLAATTLCNI